MQGLFYGTNCASMQPMVDAADAVASPTTAVPAEVDATDEAPADAASTDVATDEAPAESASEPVVQSASERIPKDSEGNLLYEQADAELAWDALVEQTDGDEAMAQTVADEMVADKEAALKKLEKAKSQGGASVSEKIAAAQKRKAEIDAAQAQVDSWKAIAGVSAQRRAAEAAAAEAAHRAEEHARREAEAAEIAARKIAEEEAAAAVEEAARLKREALNGVPDWVDNTPTDARSRGYRRVNGEKVERQQAVLAQPGRRVSVKFADGVIPTGNVAVVEASQLQPSHLLGRRNPLHFIDEAQPKERNDAASIISARKMSSQMRPEEITSSVTAYTGAPTVNARGEVIQGNNRSDALRLMWEEQAEVAAAYKQYLLEHAEEFGIDAEMVELMEAPILVNMLDVTDEEAIELGQYVAQDTESGGVERIEPKNAVQKMGSDLSIFAQKLLRSSDEEDSFATLIDVNGVDVLKWMQQKGYITPTQYTSAFDSRGNLSAEAKNDLKSIMYQSIFKGGSTQLEEMFNAMPAKAQKAILATAFRDYESPNSERMIEEIQNSIRAFYALSQSEDFVNAKTYKDARLAVEGWKIQYQMDDVTGESYLPADKFSNFALHLATMYKGENQSVIQGTFNKMFDLIQGIQEADLFNANPDATPRTLVEAIKEILNIDYNGQLRSNVLGDNHPASQGGQQGSTGNVASGERNQDKQGTEDGGRRTEGNGGRSRNDEEREDNLRSDRLRGIKRGRTEEFIDGHLSKVESDAVVSLMKSTAEVTNDLELNPDTWESEFGESGMMETPVGVVKMGENQYLKLLKKNRANYFGMIKPTLTNPDLVLEEYDPKEGAERQSKYLFVKTFIKADGSRYVHFESVTVQKETLEVSISSHEINEDALLKKMQQTKLLHLNDKFFNSDGRLIKPLDEGSDLVPTPNSVSSDSKVTDKSSAEQKNEGENISEPTHETETLENGDVRITNRNSRGEVETVAIERDGKIVSVDSYQDGALFEHTEYDTDGRATMVTRYGKDGEVVGVQRYEGGILVSQEAADAEGRDDVAADETINGAVDMGTMRLVMTDTEFESLLKNGSREEVNAYLGEIEDALRVGEGAPLDGANAVRADYRSAVEQYGKDNIPADVMRGLEARMQSFDDLKRALFDRKYALEDRIRALDAQAEAEQEALEKAEKAAQKQTAFGGFLAGKTALAAANAEKALNKKYKFDGEVMSVAEFVERHANDGTLALSTSEVNKYKGASRSAWNRMSEAEQKADEERVKNGGTKTVYMVNGYDLGKTAYEYAQYLQGQSTEYREQSTTERIAQAEGETNVAPTDGQKEAGNYKKGHVRVAGYDISIEQPKGSVRRGVDANGNEWEQVMQNTYGYIRGTEGVDGDHMDVFLANDMDAWNGEQVFVVDQYNEDGSFDEHKVMLGFNSIEEAQSAYLSNYEDGWADKHRIVVTGTNAADFKKWVDSSHRKTKAFADYKNVKKNEGQSGTDNSGRDDVAADGKKNGTTDYNIADEALMAERGSEAFARATERTIDALKAAGVEVVEATDAMVEEVLGLAEMHKQKKAPETASVQEEHQPTVVSSADGAKLLKDLDSAITEYENKSGQSKTFLGDIAQVLGATKHGSNSQYATFEAVNGKVFTIRLANHNAKVSNFDNHGENEGISIVVTAQDNNGINNDGNAHVVEFFYDAIKLRKADGKPLVEILKSIKQALYSGEYKDTTGLAQAEEVNIPEFMQVYHGSGAKFDKFDHSFMGSGEGNQAFGWGTYVTEVEGIGRTYAGIGGQTVMTYKGSELDTEGLLNPWRIIKDLYDENHGRLRDMRSRAERILGMVEDDNIEMKQLWQSVVDTLKQVRAGELKVKPSRLLYTVEIPDDNGTNYLLHDKDVPKHVKNAVKEKLYASLAADDAYKGAERELRKELDDLFALDMDGGTLYGNVAAYLGSDKETSEFLNRIGFVGIKYPTSTLSGGNKDGKSNYVIFNEADAQITDRVEFLRTADGVVYGWAVGGKVYLTKEGMNPNTPAHEYTHLWAQMVEQNDPTLWGRIVDGLRGCATWNDVLNDKAYEGIRGDDSRMASEVLSRLTGAENYRREMARAQAEIADAKGVFDKAEKVSVWENVKQALRLFLDKVKSLILKGERREEETVRVVEGDVPAWMEFVDMALGDLYGGVNPGDRGGSAELMFIGEKGAAAMDKAEEASVRLDNLAVARDMEAQGKEALAIKMATGWERGADGKWRYEVMDVKDFDIRGNIDFGKRHPEVLKEYERFRKLRAKKTLYAMQGLELSEAEQSELDSLSPLWLGTQLHNSRKLKDYVDAPELFAAYPELRDIQVRFENLELGSLGYYRPSEGKIGIKSALDKETMMSVLNHEIQHAIQHIEGFARGGNIRRVKSKVDVFKEEARVLYDKMLETREWAEKMRLQRRWFDETNESELAKIESRIEEIDNSGVLREIETMQSELSKKYGLDANVGKILSEPHADNAEIWEQLPESFYDKYDVYSRLAGEVEARNTQARMGKSQEERRASLASETADVAKEDQIFIYNGLESASSEVDIDAVNARFNAELDGYINGNSKANMMFHVGNPMGVMQIFLPNLPIVMRPRVINKATNTKHDVSVEALHDLPKHISSPIFVFQRDDNALGVLTEIKDNNGKNVCVAIELNKIIQDGGSYLEVNDIRSIHGRDIENLILPIIHNNTLKYVDKEKGLDWLSSASSNYQQEITKQDLVSATKVVESFENPQILEQENDGDTLFSYKPVGGNKGYVGYSMSKRAAQARAEGRFPKTDFKKEYGVTERVLDALVKAGVVDNSEWHHTSSYGNRTPFYGWEGDSYANYYADNKSEIDKIVSDLAKTEPKFKDYEKTQDGADAFTEQHRIWLKRKEEEIQDLQERFEKAEEAWQEAERARREAVLKETRLRTEYNTYIRNLNVPEEYKASNGVRVVTHRDGNPYRWDYYWGENKAFKKYSDVAREELKQFLEANRGDVPNFEEWKEGVATASQLTGQDGETATGLRGESGADVVQRMGDGALSDDAVSDANDLVGKALGKRRYGAKQRAEFAERQRRNMAKAVERMAKQLHLDNVEVVTDVNELPEGKKRGAKGFYSKSTGRITIVVPNHSGLYDIEMTMLHEAVAHYGLRKLFGKHFDTFLDNVYQNASLEVRQKIASLAAKNGWDFRTATEDVTKKNSFYFPFVIKKQSINEYPLF